MPPRARFCGSIGDLADALAPHFSFPGAVVRYAEGRPGSDKLALRSDPLRNMIRDMFKRAPNLSFTQKHVEAALVKVSAMNKFSLAQSELQDFSRRSAQKLRLACRHAAQGLIKSPNSVWVQDLFSGMDLEHAPQAKAKAARKRPAGKKEPIFLYECQLVA